MTCGHVSLAAAAMGQSYMWSEGGGGGGDEDMVEDLGVGGPPLLDQLTVSSSTAGVVAGSMF